MSGYLCTIIVIATVNKTKVSKCEKAAHLDLTLENSCIGQNEDERNLQPRSYQSAPHKASEECYLSYLFYFFQLSHLSMIFLNNRENSLL